MTHKQNDMNKRWQTKRENYSTITLLTPRVPASLPFSQITN